jgi:signal transduction histidine kinase
MRSGLSFRTRIVLTVLTVAVVPLALVGLWLTRATARSGEQLAEHRLQEALDRTTSQIASSWVRRRSELLDLADASNLPRLLAERMAPDWETLLTASERLRSWVHRITVLDADGVERWSTGLEAPGDPIAAEPLEPGLAVHLGLYERASGRQVGMLEAELAVTALLPRGGADPALAGLVLGVFEPGSQISLLPLPFDPSLLANEQFEWAGEAWLSDGRTLEEPPVVLIAATPLPPFVAPFEDAARNGTRVLFVVALVGVGLAILLANRLTRSLKGLSVAAEAVSQGDLDRRIEVHGRDEVGRVAQAFNAMTESLRRTLSQLANRESLAAVGEFAASLAHEVRNPLTAVRIDLQSVEEQLPDDSPLREPQARALREISRLDETVARTLRVARSGTVRLRPMDLVAPVTAATKAASPAFEARDATLEYEPPSDGVPILGDAGALEQVFLNLLQNAVHALGTGGQAEVAVSVEEESATVHVRDDGGGMTPEVREKAFDPLFTTRRAGTGLGLTIARRIVVAHGGEIDLDSEPGRGTNVRVRFALGPGRDLLGPMVGVQHPADV